MADEIILKKIYYNEIFFEDKSDYKPIANSYNVVIILLRKAYYVLKKKKSDPYINHLTS